MSSSSDSVLKGYEETKVEYRRLGRSGLRVSVPIFGCMSFGDKRWQDWVIEEEEALPLLKAAYDRGLHTWDTANVYSNGASERIIAAAIKKYEIPRDKLVLMSKCEGYVGEEMEVRMYLYGQKGKDSKEYVNQGGLSRKAIFTAVEASLRRLETDYLDVLQIHRADADTPPGETMEALHDLIRMGKVRYIGASSMWAYQFATYQFAAEKNGWTKFISMQNHYSLLYREEEREMNKLCNETGVGLIPWGPLCRGHLARSLAQFGETTRSAAEPKNDAFPGQSEVDRQIIERVQELAEKKGWKMSTVALAWINKRVTSPIVGFSSVARMDEAIEARGKTLAEEEEKYLEELYKTRDVFGHR